MKKAIHSENGRITDICEPGQEFPISEPLEWIDVADDTTETDTWDGTQVVKFVPHVPDYAELRQGAYASWGDQMDMQFHDLLDDTTTWRDHVATVKAAHPKPD
jgi:hypothetical protein